MSDWNAQLTDHAQLWPPSSPAVGAAARARRHAACLKALHESEAHRRLAALEKKIAGAEKELAGGEANVRKASKARRELLGRAVEGGGADVAALLGTLGVADGVAQGRKDALVAG